MKPPPATAYVNRLIALSLALLLFSGTLGLGAVWVRQEISQTANRSRALVAKLADVERRLDDVNTAIAAAVNPKALVDQNNAMRLGLAMTKETQVRRIEGSPELRLLARMNRDNFNRASAETSADGLPAFRVIVASATLP
jgi:hypothetical protein